MIKCAYFLYFSDQTDLPCSHTEKRDSKQDYFTDSRNEHENDALLEERQEGRLGRDKEPVSSKLHRKYQRGSKESGQQEILLNTVFVDIEDAYDKGNKHQQLASNSVNEEENGPRREMNNDRKPTTSYNPSISNYAGESANQRMSSNFVYEEELCPSEKEYEQRSGTSYNPPALNRSRGTENQPMSMNGAENYFKEVDHDGRPATSYNPPISNLTEANDKQAISTNGRRNSTGGEKDDKGLTTGNIPPYPDHTEETDNQPVSSGNSTESGETCHRVRVIVTAPYSQHVRETENQ
jgi:hypothetical protein